MNIQRLVLFALIIFAQCKNDPASTTGNDNAPLLDGTFNGYEDRLKNDAQFAIAVREQNQRVLKFINGNRAIGTAGVFSGVVTIPVVVHVVYNNATENIPNTTIQDQIAALNRDFRMTDAAAIAALPPAFRSKATDARIQFVLAKRTNTCTAPADPLGAINRVSTSMPDFPFNVLGGSATLRNPVKFTVSGGSNGWPSDEYLNIWVCDLSSTNTGYASLPAHLASRPGEDGVVVDYEYFGNGISKPTRNMGKTCTKLVAKWLGLKDIWGTLPSGCSDSDFDAAFAAFDDTPNQDIPNTGCPTFPDISCSNGPDGDNFQNLMDETDDACRVMFTCGQADVMNAILATTRIGILHSNAATPPAASAQLWIKDGTQDTGDEVTNPTSPLYQSDDLWVRNQSDGTTNQEHQNARSAAANWVYVRVRNPGCTAATATQVKLYWAKASPSLSWPSPWDGSMGGTPAMGGLIGIQTTSALAGSESEILTFPWTAPNIGDYSGFGSDAGHFCLLAEVQNGPTSTLVNYPGDLQAYVRNNREVAWKNIGVTALGGTSLISPKMAFSSILLGNFGEKPKETKLVFDNLENETPLFELGKIYLKGHVVKKWLDSPRQGSGIHAEGDSVIIDKAGASMEGLLFNPKEVQGLYVGYTSDKAPGLQRRVYKLRVEEFEKKNNEYEFTGGQVFTIKDELITNDRPKDEQPPVKRWWYYLAGLVLALLAYWFFRKKK